MPTSSKWNKEFLFYKSGCYLQRACSRFSFIMYEYDFLFQALKHVFQGLKHKFQALKYKFQALKHKKQMGIIRFQLNSL